MRKSVDEFRSLGQSHFSAADLDACINMIRELAHDSSAEFFQLMQLGDDLQLEYAALLPNAVIDFTLRQRGTAVTTVPLRFVAEVSHNLVNPEPPNPGRLDVLIVVNAPFPSLVAQFPHALSNLPSPYLRYTTTQIAGSERLKSFSYALQRALLAGSQR